MGASDAILLGGPPSQIGVAENISATCTPISPGILSGDRESVNRSLPFDSAQ
jgi:hypothetical protein